MGVMEIVYIKRGIANRIGNKILLHESLRKPEYAALRQHSVQHELAHSEGGITAHDLIHDVVDLLQPKIVSKQFFKFYFSERGAWQQSLPFFYYEGRLYWDISKLWQFSLMVIVTVIGIWLLT